jgi:hypothetical protein
MFQMKKVIDTVAVNKTFPSRFCNTTVVWKYRIHIHTVLFACLKHTSAELRNESYHSRMEVAQIIIINRCFLASYAQRFSDVSLLTFVGRPVRL